MASDVGVAVSEAPSVGRRPALACASRRAGGVRGWPLGARCCARTPLGIESAGEAAWHGLLLALGFLVLEGAQAHVEVRRQTFSITLSEAPLVVGLALTSPLVLLLSRGLAMVVSEVHTALPA